VICVAPIIKHSELSAWRAALPRTSGPLVLTNGCFDLLHSGHVHYLTEARNLGGCLLVAVNDDDSVRALKGNGRPVNSAADRCAVLAALRAVDAVTIFSGKRMTSVIHEVRPDIYVKGGDYTPETLDAGEGAALREVGARIEILSLVPGKSTTNTLARLNKNLQDT
jgi:rfaE bifunctional protein nucleotidyltransferase chain/domain